MPHLQKSAVRRGWRPRTSSFASCPSDTDGGWRVSRELVGRAATAFGNCACVYYWIHRLLVLDTATASVDAETEHDIHTALDRAAHRPHDACRFESHEYAPADGRDTCLGKRTNRSAGPSSGTLGQFRSIPTRRVAVCRPNRRSVFDGSRRIVSRQVLTLSNRPALATPARTLVRHRGTRREYARPATAGFAFDLADAAVHTSPTRRSGLLLMVLVQDPCRFPR